MSLEYKVYSGAGNILAVIESSFPKEKIIDFCLEHSLDGIICLSSCLSADVFMQIFNSDGSEAEMCGNGLRIVIKHLFSKTSKMNYSIATLSGIYSGYINDDIVMVNMTRSFWDFRSDICVTHKNETFLCHFINTGVPHAVVFTNDINMNIQDLGAAIRFSKIFSPDGVNVDFVFGVENPQDVLFIRTYERGVERETGSCGTGVTAAALVASKIYDLPSPIKFLTTSKEYLTVYFDFLWNKVMLGGKVNLVREGIFCLNTDIINC